MNMTERSTTFDEEKRDAVPASNAGGGMAQKMRQTFSAWRQIRQESSARGRALYSLAGIGILVVIWHILTMGEPTQRVIKPIALPSITETLQSFESLWFDRALARSAFWSLGRVFGGFLLAASVAIPMGVLAACFWRINALLRPISVFGRNIPIAALIPLTLIWFGLGETQKVMFIFLASGAFIFFDSTNAVNGVSNSYLDTAHTLGAKRVPREGLIQASIAGVVHGMIFLGVAFLMGSNSTVVSKLAWCLGGFIGGMLLWYPILVNQVIKKVILPLAAPDIVNSLRLLFGLAFGYIMLAEVINAKHGLGSIIIISQRLGPREHIYLCLVLIAALAYAIDRGILWIQYKLYPYRKEL